MSLELQMNCSKMTGLHPTEDQDLEAMHLELLVVSMCDLLVEVHNRQGQVLGIGFAIEVDLNLRIELNSLINIVLIESLCSNTIILL